MLKISVDGDPNIGLYGFATEKHYVTGVQGNNAKKVAKELKVKPAASIVMNTYFAGIFLAGNSSGIVCSKFAHDYGFSIAKDMPVLFVGTRHTALGNMLLLNDHGGIISPLLRKNKKEIEEFLGIKTEVSTVAGLKIPGSAAIATNKGCIAHPKIKDKEKELLESVLGVPVTIGTVNYGSPYVKAGIVANSRSFAASPQSSGHELGNIVEGLGFLGK